MWKFIRWCGSAALFAGLAAVPGQAEVLYAWTTEDGVYAYADDAKKVPARYKSQVRKSERKQLADYERFTRKDAAASERYAREMATRLDELRALNAPSLQDWESGALARAGERRVSRFNVAAGREDGPRVSLSTDSPEPVVIEPVISRRPGDSVTRRTTLVTQGDRTIAILKGPRHHRNPITDVIDERDL